jgi:competence protein ComEC
VGVIAIALQGVLQLLRVPRRTAVVAGLGLLWLYVQVTGAGLPARRAFLMIAFLQGARVLRRPWNSLAALTLAALVTLLLDPQQLFNAGFQMSYSVVTALVVMGAPLSRRWEAAWRPWRDLPEANWGRRRRAITWLGQRILGALAISWVALLASTPAMIGNFGLLSPGSLLANLVIIPLALSAISAGFAALVPGLFHLMPVSYFFNHAAVLLIKTMEWLVTHGAVFPGVFFPASFARPWMAPAAQAFVLATMLLGASLRWRRSLGGFWPPALALVLVVFLGVKFG